MGKDRRRKNGSRTQSEDSSRTKSGSGSRGYHTRSPRQVPVLFTPSSSASTTRQSTTSSSTSATPTPSTSAENTSESVSSKHGTYSDSAHTCSRNKKRAFQRDHSRKKTVRTTHGGSSLQSFQAIASRSPSSSKTPQTDYSKCGDSDHKWKQTSKHAPYQLKERVHPKSSKMGGKHCPTEFKSRQASKWSHTSTRAEEQIDSSQQPATTSLDIPGFYYDAEKKKYFKILPTSGNVNVITKETIARDKAEAQRQKDLKTFGSGAAARPATQSSTVPSLVTPPVRRQNVCQTLGYVLLGAYQRNEISPFRLQKLLTLDTMTGLRPAGCADLCFAPNATPGIYEKLEHMHQMEISQDHGKILCLWSVRGSVIQRLQLVTLREATRTCPGHLSLEFDPSGTTVLQSWSKITSVSLADFPQYPGKKYVLYTTMCHTGQAYSLAFIRNLDPDYGDNINFFDFNLGTRATWTCAWNCKKQQFSVGTEKGCLVLDVNTRRLWQFRTHNSDALAQVFSKEDGGNLMYTGTRRGQILLHDLRSSSTFPTTLMSHKSSLSCLRLSSDETYLYASDFNGNINKWDLRMQGTVMSYDGLFNQYTKLPFYIDETESILYGAGQDCYSKVWNLNSGKLLLSIPPPCEASRDTIPAFQFSTHWAGVPGNAGLIMGMKDKFFLYGSGLEDGASGAVVTDRWQHAWISVITTG